MDSSSEKNSRKEYNGFAKYNGSANGFKMVQQSGGLFPKSNGQPFTSTSNNGIKPEEQSGKTGAKTENKPASNMSTKDITDQRYEELSENINNEDNSSSSDNTYIVEESVENSEDGINAAQQGKDYTGDTYAESENKPTSSTSSNNLHATQRNSKKKQRKEKLSFKPYISRLKKEKTPTMKLSATVMKDLDELLSSVYEAYCCEFKKLLGFTKNKTLSEKEVETVTKLCIPGKRRDNVVNFARECVRSEKI